MEFPNGTRARLAELTADPERIANLDREDVPDLLSALESVRARLWSRLSRPPAAAESPGNGANPDQMLNAEQVAEILEVDTRYVYDHADDWPFTRRISARTLRFSETGLYRWLDTRR